MANKFENMPSFHISVLADMLDLHPQTIRNYERMGLINPHRTTGNMRLFSPEEVEKVRKIQSYTNIGVNLAGVEIIMKLLDQLEESRTDMEDKMEKMKKRMSRMRKLIEDQGIELD